MRMLGIGENTQYLIIGRFNDLDERCGSIIAQQAGEVTGIKIGQ